MKVNLIKLIALPLAFLVFSCGKSGHDHSDHDHAAAEDETGKLYEEVMRLHDDGMEKMDELHRLKEGLKKTVASTPEMTDEKRKEIEAKISKLDSAGKGMMVWMRQFHPEDDSLNDEAYHEYLEAERDKVKKVKDDIFDAIARAKEE